MADLLQKNEHEARTMLTVKEVREVYGIARSTVYRWIDRCWLRKFGQIQALENQKHQKIVLLEIVDSDLQEQFDTWVKMRHEAGHAPSFFADTLTDRDAVDAEALDPRLESKRLVKELDALICKLDQQSEQRDILLGELDRLPAIQPSSTKQAKVGFKEIVDLLKEISNREEELREETATLPDDLELPEVAGASEEFIRELGEERGTGLENKSNDQAPNDTSPDPDPSLDLDLHLQPLFEEEELAAGESDPDEQSDLDKLEEQVAEFAFLADPETLDDEEEWIDLQIDDGESPLLKEELVALDESFLPGSKRRGIKIDLDRAILSETELTELSTTQDALQEAEAVTDPEDDEQNDSWLGISIPAEEESPADLAEDPYDPTGDFLEGEELRLLHSDPDSDSAEGFYLDGEELRARPRDDRPRTDEIEDQESAEEEYLEFELQESDAEWVSPAPGEFDASITDMESEETWLQEPEAEPVDNDLDVGDADGELGISEEMLVGDDAIELEADEEFLEIEAACNAERSSTDPVPEEESDLSNLDVAEPNALSLEDLEGDALMTFDDLDGDLDLAFEIEDDDVVACGEAEDPLGIEPELDEPADAVFSPAADPQPDITTDADGEAEPQTIEPEPASTTLEDGPPDATDHGRPTSLPLPAAACTEAAPVASATPAGNAPPPALTAEAFESSTEMIKEGMIGIRLSILEVKEGLGILQDPVDSVSKHAEQVNEGVREIASEARETRRILEEIGSRLETLDVPSLRSVANQNLATGNSLITGIGLGLLVLTWCLGLYLRGEGLKISLYLVFAANVVVTLAILMLRSPSTSETDANPAG